MSNNSAANTRCPLVPFAYASGVVSGGVVGYDYGTWLDVPPAIGAIIGAIVSSVLTGVLLSIIQSRELRGRLIGFGAFAGAVVGAWAMMISEPGVANFLGGALVGGVFGAIAGMVAFLLIFVSAAFLLLISRGPIALFLRNTISDSQDTEAALAAPLADLDGTEYALIELVGACTQGVLA